MEYLEPLVFKLYGGISYMSIKSTPYTEECLRLIFKLPDALFKCCRTTTPFSKNLDAPISITYAYDGKNPITNKFKTFINLYWDKDLDAFDFQQFVKLFDSNKLYCRYRDTSTSIDYLIYVFIGKNDVYFNKLRIDDALLSDIDEMPSSYIQAPFGCIEF